MGIFDFLKKKDLKNIDNEEILKEENNKNKKENNEQEIVNENKIEKKIKTNTIENKLNKNIEKKEITEIKNELSNEEDNKNEGFNNIFKGLTKTRKNILGNLEKVIKSFKIIDEEFFEELEEILIISDIGIETSNKIIDKVKDRVVKEKIKDTDYIKNIMIEEITSILKQDEKKFEIKIPTVILIVGVNGVGKTTTIGKLANKFKIENKKVILSASDTFRAAAIDQIESWGKISNACIVKHQENSDPGSVIYDAIKASKSRKADILICDTAGRLHNKKNLMEELRKIFKIVNNEYKEANIEVFLVLDATTGQNAMQQAKMFKEVSNITGIILTKLDGTAKGGIVIAIKNELNIPIRYICIGEKVDDIQEFDAEEFAKSILGENNL